MIHLDEVRITDHALLRWSMRVDHENDSREDIRQAFDEALPVGEKHRSATNQRLRLHPPTNTLFVYKTDSGTAVIVTVLEAVEHRIETRHLSECDDCGKRIPGDVDACPWCAADDEGKPAG